MLNEQRETNKSRQEEPDRCPAPQLQLTAFNSLVSQFWPVQPGMHSQKYPPIRLRHELALTQGLLSHSLASREGDKGLVAFACAVDRCEVVERVKEAGWLTNQARLPCPLRGTVTLVTVNQILAGTAVIAGVWRAVVNIYTEEEEEEVHSGYSTGYFRWRLRYFLAG